jgi:hypothetical protein
VSVWANARESLQDVATPRSELDESWLDEVPDDALPGVLEAAYLPDEVFEYLRRKGRTL